MTCGKVTGEKVTGENEGVTMRHERIEVNATGGKMIGTKEARVDVSKVKSTTGMMT